MLTSKRTGRKNGSDPFAFFKEASAVAFKFLAENYGFEERSTTVHPPECAIKYENRTTGVIVTYEFDGVVWVDLRRIENNERYSLDVLLLACQPEQTIDEFYASDGESRNQYVSRVLHRYADILNDCGRDILVGDFHLFPKLRMLSEQLSRLRNA